MHSAASPNGTRWTVDPANVQTSLMSLLACPGMVPNACVEVSATADDVRDSIDDPHEGPDMAAVRLVAEPHVSITPPAGEGAAVRLTYGRC